MKLKPTCKATCGSYPLAKPGLCLLALLALIPALKGCSHVPAKATEQSALTARYLKQAIKENRELNDRLGAVPAAVGGRPGSSQPPISESAQAPRKLGTFQYRAIKSASEKEVAGIPAQVVFSTYAKSLQGDLDPNLVALRRQKSGSIFALAAIKARPLPGLKRSLQAQGLRLLSKHTETYKMVLSPDAKLETLAEHPAVIWLGLPDPEQKIGSSLRGALSAFSSKKYPVILSAFAPEAVAPLLRDMRSNAFEVLESQGHAGVIRLLATQNEITTLSTRDEVLFLELDVPIDHYLAESVPETGADRIPLWSLLGVSARVGVIDSGFHLQRGASGGHVDLWKHACGKNFGSGGDEELWAPADLHGTAVLGALAGTGAANPTRRGLAPAVGLSPAAKLRLARSGATGASIISSLDFMAEEQACNSARPHIVNLSGGTTELGNEGNRGTDFLARRVDRNTFNQQILHINAAGNSGPVPISLGTPESAKSALTVGATGGNPGRGVALTSSRGPTSDKRLKPNVVAPGASVTMPGTPPDNYVSQSGTSYAAPLVAGLTAFAMELMPDLKSRPALARALLMATAYLGNGEDKNAVGLGRVSATRLLKNRDTEDGWTTSYIFADAFKDDLGFIDFDVARGTQRLKVVMTWDEPPASSGAGKAVIHDLDLYLDHEADCPFDGACGEYFSTSAVDNTEYVIVDQPPHGPYRLKVLGIDYPEEGLPVAVAISQIRGNPLAGLSLQIGQGQTNLPRVVIAKDGEFTLPVTVRNSSYIAHGTQLAARKAGLQNPTANMTFTRGDGISVSTSLPTAMLGEIAAGAEQTVHVTFKEERSGYVYIDFVLTAANGAVLERQVPIFVQQSDQDALPF